MDGGFSSATPITITGILPTSTALRHFPLYLEIAGVALFGIQHRTRVTNIWRSIEDLFPLPAKGHAVNVKIIATPDAVRFTAISAWRRRRLFRAAERRGVNPAVLRIAPESSCISARNTVLRVVTSPKSLLDEYQSC